MAEITEKELKKQIANGMFSPVYLLYGEEAFLKQYYAGLIAEKSVAKGFETFNLHKLEGKGDLIGRNCRRGGATAHDGGAHLCARAGF